MVSFSFDYLLNFESVDEVSCWLLFIYRNIHGVQDSSTIIFSSFVFVVNICERTTYFAYKSHLWLLGIKLMLVTQFRLVHTNLFFSVQTLSVSKLVSVTRFSVKLCFSFEDFLACFGKYFDCLNENISSHLQFHQFRSKFGLVQNLAPKRYTSRIKESEQMNR